MTSEQFTSLRRTGDQILLELARSQFKDDLQTTQCLSEGGNVFQIVEVVFTQVFYISLPALFCMLLFCSEKKRVKVKELRILA